MSNERRIVLRTAQSIYHTIGALIAKCISGSIATLPDGESTKQTDDVGGFHEVSFKLGPQGLRAANQSGIDPCCSPPIGGRGGEGPAAWSDNEG